MNNLEQMNRKSNCHPALLKTKWWSYLWLRLTRSRSPPRRRPVPRPMNEAKRSAIARRHLPCAKHLSPGSPRPKKLRKVPRKGGERAEALERTKTDRVKKKPQEEGKRHYNRKRTKSSEINPILAQDMDFREPKLAKIWKILVVDDLIAYPPSLLPLIRYNT